MTNGLIISATDTDVGKTVFAAALVDALGAHYWKPIQAGLDSPTDTQTVCRLTNPNPERIHTEAYRLKTPYSPHRAAHLDGITIDPTKLEIPAKAKSSDQPLIIEGAGGLLVPLSKTHLQIDQFATWKLPIILCARTTLGTINHTLLSVEAIRNRNLPLAGIAFIGEPNDDTQRTITDITGATVLGRLPMIDPLKKETLSAAFKSAFQINEIMRTP